MMIMYRLGLSGMDKATDVVLGGLSAGGLAVFLRADSIKAR